MFENRIPWRVCGPKRDENGKWKRVLNEELYSLYSSPNLFRPIKFKKSRWAFHVARKEEGRSAFVILTGKLIGKRFLRTPRRRGEENITIGLKEMVSI